MFKTLIFPALVGGCLITPFAANAQDPTPASATPGVSSGVQIEEGDAPQLPAPSVNASVEATPSLVDDIQPVESSDAHSKPAVLPSQSHAAPVHSHEGEVVHGHHGHGVPAVGGHIAGKAAAVGRKIALAANPNGWYPPYAAHPWHGYYRHTQYSQPLAMVVPPTASRQTAWSWGVGNTTVQPIYHQFGRQYPGAGPQAVGGPYWQGGQQFAPTPHWPSHTDQFGVYYIRGPW